MKLKRPVRKQHTPEEIRDELLRFIRTKFYQGEAVEFEKDRPRLLKLVVLKFASWLDERGVTLPSDRYLAIMRDTILMDAVRFGTAEIKYRPGWLGVVVEKHLAHHGEEYYEEAKALRSVVETSLMLARAGVQGRDPVRELAQASRLLKAKKRVIKPVVNDQLNLL